MSGKRYNYWDEWDRQEAEAHRRREEFRRRRESEAAAAEAGMADVTAVDGGFGYRPPAPMMPEVPGEPTGTSAIPGAAVRGVSAGWRRDEDERRQGLGLPDVGAPEAVRMREAVSYANGADGEASKADGGFGFRPGEVPDPSMGFGGFDPMDAARGAARGVRKVGIRLGRETLGESAALGARGYGAVLDAFSVPATLVSPEAGERYAREADRFRGMGDDAVRWGRGGQRPMGAMTPEVPGEPMRTPAIPGEPEVPGGAMRMPEGPGEPTGTSAFPGGAGRRPLSEEVLEDPGLRPSYDAREVLERGGMTENAQGHVRLGMETGYPVGSTLPDAGDLMRASEARIRAREGEDARRGYEAEFRHEDSPGWLRRGGDVPGPSREDWDDYNRRVRGNAVRAGIAAPDEQDAGELARWAAGEMRRAGDARFSVDARKASAERVGEYQADRSAQAQAEERSRMAADARDRDRWMGTATGGVFDKETGQMAFVPESGGERLHVVSGALVDSAGNEVYRAPKGQVFLGMSVADFETMNSPMLNFSRTKEQREEWQAFAGRFLEEMMAAGKKGKAAPAPTGGDANDVGEEGSGIWDPES